MEKIKLGKKYFSPSTVRVFQIIFLIFGVVFLLFGLLFLFISLFAGVLIILLGIFYISMCITYSKLIKSAKESKNNLPMSESKEASVLQGNNKDYSPSSVSVEKVTPSFSPINVEEQLQHASAVTKPRFPEERHIVAGTSYRQKEIHSLGYENPDYGMSKREIIDCGVEDDKIYQLDFSPTKVVLEEEPDNKYDSNAIKVIVDDVHVGYIKKGSCSHVKKLIREDKINSIRAEIYGGKYKVVYSDYDDEKDKDVYTLERDEYNFAISLYITLK